MTVWGQMLAHLMLGRSQQQPDWQSVSNTLHPKWQVLVKWILITLEYWLLNLEVSSSDISPSKMHVGYLYPTQNGFVGAS